MMLTYSLVFEAGMNVTMAILPAHANIFATLRTEYAYC
jgi:hypothetical protein